MTTPTSTPRRAAAAAFIGTTIEFYDFYIYAFAAALVLGQLFFPSDNAVLSTCLLYTSPSPRDLSTSRMPSSA